MLRVLNIFAMANIFVILVVFVGAGAGYETSINNLLREFQNLSNLKDVFLSAPDPRKPSLDLTIDQTATKKTGESVLLTCVVSHKGDHSVMWKRVSKNKSAGDKLLTINSDVVTQDKRFGVLHEDGGDVYVLTIQNLTAHESGIYSCELNTEPPTISRHELRVLHTRRVEHLEDEDNTDNLDKIEEDEPTFDEDYYYDLYDEYGVDNDEIFMRYIKNHEDKFSSCCLQSKISSGCLESCDLANLFYANTSLTSEACSQDVGAIVRCLADGRDHAPCCLYSGVPDPCTDLCRPAPDVQITTSLLTQCASYHDPILTCVAAGIQTIPSPAEGVSATALNSTSIRVAWRHGHDTHHLRHHYTVNITYITSLTREFMKSFPTQKKLPPPAPFTLHEVGKDETSLSITNLRQFSVYGVTVVAVNKDGDNSLPTAGVKVVTHVEGDSLSPSHPQPELPDTMSCCMQNNVTHNKCAQSFCDPRALPHVGLSDMITCAPWSQKMFTCLTDKIDHRPCCATRGVPSTCLELCSDQPPSFTRADFRYLACFQYMPDMSSCLLEGYNVLPSSPTGLRYSNLQHNFVILHWDPPAKHGDSAFEYEVVAQKVGPAPGPVVTYTQAHSPFILEKLESRSAYEVYVKAVNGYGIGEPSSRLVFRTKSEREELEESKVGHHSGHNMSRCCVNVGVSPTCQALCSYDITAEHLNNLTDTCASEMDKILRCGTGGRDHMPCCKRRGISKSCAPLCQSVSQVSTGTHWSDCGHEMGFIFMCYEEGAHVLPPPITDFVAARVDNHGVLLKWRVDNETGTTDHYEVSYKQVPDKQKSSDIFKTQYQITSHVPMVKVDNLTNNMIYSFFVVAKNSHGSSLPSSILTLNISLAAWNGATVGATSPPHMVTIGKRTVSTLEVSWNPPAISHPEDQLAYKVYYTQVFDVNTNETIGAPKMIATDKLSLELTDLVPDSLYKVWVTSVTVQLEEDQVESERGEVIAAWTKSYIPAFVQMRFVQSVKIPGFGPGRLIRKTVDTVDEGGSLTVLCLAGGEPVPKLSLSINGVILHSQTALMMTTVIHNITRDVKFISCFAENGVGMPMESSKMITVNRAPVITAPMLSTVVAGDTLVLQCSVDAYPAPSLSFSRDHDHKIGMIGINDTRVKVSAFTDRDEVGKFVVTMSISNVTQADGGQYFCYAKNKVGFTTTAMGVQVVNILPSNHTDNIGQCCSKRNVSSDCMDICQSGVTYESLTSRPECLAEYESILQCASDGVDHSLCCRNNHVPDTCVGWCSNGGHVETDQVEICAITYSREIIGCLNGKTSAKSRKNSKTEIPRNKAKVAKSNFNETVGITDSSNEIEPTTSTTVKPSKIEANAANNSDNTENVIKTSRRVVTNIIDNEQDNEVVQSANERSDRNSLIGLAICCIVIASGVALLLYKGCKRQLSLPVVRRPNLPQFNLNNPFYSKNEGFVVEEEYDSMPAHLENLNYHQVNQFSIHDDDDNEATETVQETQSSEIEQNSSSGFFDRLRSGVVSTKGFERF